jgi:hypothetical protein
MHYRDGQEVKLGDICKAKCWTGEGEDELTGVVFGLQAQSDTCNVLMVTTGLHCTFDYSQTPAPLLRAIPIQREFWFTAKDGELVRREFNG